MPPHPADRPFSSTRITHMPSSREALTADIFDALSELSTIYGLGSRTQFDLLERVARFDDAGLRRLARDLRRAAQELE